jgi:hypothetical protein
MTRQQRKNKSKKNKSSKFSIGEWLTVGLETIKKEQKHCLRFKKNKKKVFFCFIKAMVVRYPARTIVGFLLLGVTMSFFAVGDLSNKGRYFNAELETGIIQDKINSLKHKIADMKKCSDYTSDKWVKKTSDVCNYWLYEQENKSCKKYEAKGAPTKRIAIGTKICCNPVKGVQFGKGGSVQACPGADIFFDPNKMHPTIIVEDRSKCQMDVCEFYPADGFVVKRNKDGEIIRGKDGNLIIIKACTPAQKIGSCSKRCGSGTRQITIKDKYCNEYQVEEYCNVEPCFEESF